MKKTVLNFTILAFLVAIIGAGCNKPEVPTNEEKDDNTEEENKVSEYVGTWNYTSILLKNGQLLFMGNEVGTFTGEGKEIEGTIEMTENPNVYTTTVEFVAEISVFMNQQEIPVEPRTTSGTWEEVDGKLVLTQDDGTVINVLFSSPDEIVFEGNFTEQITIQLGTIDAKSDLEFTVAK